MNLPPKVYNYHPSTYVYVGWTWADESPLEPNVWLVPAHATLEAPPSIPPGYQARRVNGAWQLELVPEPEEPPSEPTPSRIISDRQFFQQLALAGFIERSEALAAVKIGEIPQALAGLLDNLPVDARFSAEMLLSGATQFDRYHPLVAQIAAAQGMSDADVDQFWIAASTL